MRGRVAVRRQYQRGSTLSRVWTARVAADDEHGLWLWIPTGSPWLDIGAADGRPFRSVPFAEWGDTETALHPYQWTNDVLMLHPPGVAHSVWFFFTPEGQFASWYVNLEFPGVRWDDGELTGIDTVDYDLDLVVSPDRSWRWKDEDEFAQHLAHPHVYWVEDEAAVWAEGRRVVELIEAGHRPFDGTGTDFRPDPGWAVPTSVPLGWDRRSALAHPARPA